MDNNTIQLREATLDDVIGMVYVQATASLACYPNPEFDIAEADVRSIDFHSQVPQWQHILQSPNYKVWVQARGEEILGLVVARKDGASQEIYTQYVLPAEQRKGLGKGLLQTALGWLDPDKPVSLRIASYLGKAIDFYKQFDFWVDPTADLDWWRLPTGKGIPLVEMRRGEPAELPIEHFSPPERVIQPLETEPEKTIQTPPATAKAQATPKNLVGRSELSQLSGVRASTIKHYTEIGLLAFVQKEARLVRRYQTETAIKRLKQIQQLRAEGLSLPDIINRLSES